ncbi:ABC transporter substrate-binding protein [Ferriphaselus sp. R-1]|uniref:ABC transporter substrate-binding protein n=1 Tax=Ferriphaselus sp. R-1 TaxID=1485544 RepID=UPI00055961A6|nr:ABC transporter substrate-binding protein [Ferriphaselus sp. R-1]
MKRLLCLILPLLLAACDDAVWNDPYPATDAGKSILYTAFSGRPKHFDPVQAYSQNEFAVIEQIYYPPLQYHFFKRPYELIPQAAQEMPLVTYLDAQLHRLPDEVAASQVAYTTYEIHLRDGLKYQPHPALALNEAGQPRYLGLDASDLTGIRKLTDFAATGTRAVTAEDYAYQIKRLAHPDLHSPIFGVMADYIVGMKEYAETLKAARKRQPEGWLDLNAYPLSGVEVIDARTYRIKVRGKYPQFAYWLAMPFFAPMPWEAERFYAQPGMRERNLSLDWWPIGSGPYYLSENDPNQRMVLTKNPNFSGELYPTEGEDEDLAAGLLADAGKPLPLVDKVVFTLEKETIPYWNKFLQGWYDSSGIGSDSFDQAVQVSVGGETNVSETMRKQGITLSTSVATSTSYMGFNWLDPVVGGSCADATKLSSTGARGGQPCNPERARKLRLAIAIAVDFEEFISIFANGRGIAAQSPIPPGIFGYLEDEAGINHYVYDWVNGAPRRKSIAEAKRLLAEAGYPGGLDKKTHKPLVIHLDSTSNGVGDKARLDWLRKQFAEIQVQLVVRSTDYNRFQDKVRRGDTQMFYYGWNADYPDPENFLFLLHGPQGKVKFAGENASNYKNPHYDALFDQMKNMDNDDERQRIINQMLEILRHDSPWLFGFHPKEYSLHHAWLYNSKPNNMASNGLKYLRIDAAQRERQRRSWNQPVRWPLWLGGLLTLLGGFWLWRKLHDRARRA